MYVLSSKCKDKRHERLAFYFLCHVLYLPERKAQCREIIRPATKGTQDFSAKPIYKLAKNERICFSGIQPNTYNKQGKIWCKKKLLFYCKKVSWHFRLSTWQPWVMLAEAYDIADHTSGAPSTNRRSSLGFVLAQINRKGVAHFRKHNGTQGIDARTPCLMMFSRLGEASARQILKC